MKKLLIPLLLAGLAIGCSGDALTDTDGFTPNFHTEITEPLTYQGQGDCSISQLVDPGTTEIRGEAVIIKGRIFDCPLTGDIEGTVRVSWRTAVFAERLPSGGQVTGTTALLITSFFDQTDLAGTFEGPFKATLEDLLFGESTTVRWGTGDFHGLKMTSVFFQDPPASGTTQESGTIEPKLR